MGAIPTCTAWPLTAPAHPVVTRDGSIDCFAVHPNTNIILLVAMLECKLQELYTYDLASGVLQQVSHFNDACLAGKIRGAAPRS